MFLYWRKVSVLLTLTLLAVASKDIAAAAGDHVKAQWEQRAALAKKKLAGGNLDACDRALEEAFLNVQEKKVGAGEERLFELDAQISDSTLRAGYGFTGNSVTTFFLAELPAKSIAIQKTKGRTISIIVGPANCALELCTTNPFKEGQCD